MQGFNVFGFRFIKSNQKKRVSNVTYNNEKIKKFFLETVYFFTKHLLLTTLSLSLYIADNLFMIYQ